MSPPLTPVPPELRSLVAIADLVNELGGHAPVEAQVDLAVLMREQGRISAVAFIQRFMRWLIENPRPKTPEIP